MACAGIIMQITRAMTMYMILGAESVKLGIMLIVVKCSAIFVFSVLLAGLVVALFLQCGSCFASFLLSGELGTDEGCAVLSLFVGGMSG